MTTDDVHYQRITAQITGGITTNDERPAVHATWTCPHGTEIAAVAYIDTDLATDLNDEIDTITGTRTEPAWESLKPLTDALADCLHQRCEQAHG